MDLLKSILDAYTNILCTEGCDLIHAIQITLNAELDYQTVNVLFYVSFPNRSLLVI
jgi:hypothetical protein